MANVSSDVHVRLESQAFPCDGLQLREVTGREAISEPFQFDVEIVAEEGRDFDARAAAGCAVTLVVEVDREEIRRIHGLVFAVDQTYDARARRTTARLRIVPRMQQLALTDTSEVFLDRSALEIALEKLRRAELEGNDVTTRVANPPSRREFVLQYAESDLAFVSRHLEAAGLFYFFEHDLEREVLVIADRNEAFSPASHSSAIHFTERADERGIRSLQTRAAVFPAKYVVNDFDETHPALSLRAEHTGRVGVGSIREFGAGHASVEEGKLIARRRFEEIAARHEVVTGESTATQLEPGRTFTVDRLPAVEGQTLVVVAVEHVLMQAAGMHEAGERAEPYRNRFWAIRTAIPYRAPRRTPRPKIAGYVHAVTEPAAEGATRRVAQLDEYGRYTVRFLFDTASGMRRGASSGRVRMLQPHAGPGYGLHFPLRPGVEVLVAFMDGDPDRPVIAGAVPNALTQSPVTQKNPQTNRIETESGVYIRMKDR